PEAAHAEQRMGEALRVGALERPAEHEMAFRGGNGGRAAGERLLRARHFQLLLEPEHDGLLLRPRRPAHPTSSAPDIQYDIQYSVAPGSLRHQNGGKPRSRSCER